MMGCGYPVILHSRVTFSPSCKSITDSGVEKKVNGTENNRNNCLSLGSKEGLHDALCERGVTIMSTMLEVLS